VVLGFATHGNESGTLPAAVRLQRELADGSLAHGGPLSLLIGNPEAVQAGQRFLDEDFNRVFTFDRPADSRERKRAEVVRPLLDAADIFLDFHQTQTPTAQAFWTFPWDARHAAWARALAAASVGVTRKAGQSFSPGTCCLDEYVRGRGKIGLTLELGMRGTDPRQAEATYNSARRLLQLVDLLETNITDLAACAQSEPPVQWYVVTQIVQADSPLTRLRPGYENWSDVSAGEVVGDANSPHLRAQSAGVVLFPKYPQPGENSPPELMRIAEKIVDPQLL